jgi:hypothetical protein
LIAGLKEKKKKNAFDGGEEKQLQLDKSPLSDVSLHQGTPQVPQQLHERAVNDGVHNYIIVSFLLQSIHHTRKGGKMQARRKGGVGYVCLLSRPRQRVLA